MWDFYELYEEDVKEADLKWYLYTFCYTKKLYNTKEGMTGIILYNKRNTSSFSKHVVTAHTMIFHNLFLTWMGGQILWMVVIPPPLREVWIPLYHIGKYQMTIPLSLVQ